MRSICLLCGYPEEKALPKTEFHAFTDNGKCSYCDAEMKEGFLFEENGNGESYAFSYTGKEESIVVPLFYSGYPVTSIKQISATVKEISLPQGIVEIGPYAFMNCKELSSIILPEGLTIVGMDAFSGCGKLQSVLLPSTLQFIGANAFAGAATEGLTIRYNGKETLWQAVDKDPSFMGDTANYTLIFEE